jgi:hypothetical protein
MRTYENQEPMRTKNYEKPMPREFPDDIDF